MRILILPLLFLSACASANIAQTSAQLERQCSTVAVVISTAQRYAHKPKVLRALAAAEAARSAFCLAPPTDQATAVLTLGTVILNVKMALKS
jgi:hypothetical protein